jgi:hypothetical protein
MGRKSHKDQEKGTVAFRRHEEFASSSGQSSTPTVPFSPLATSFEIRDLYPFRFLCPYSSIPVSGFRRLSCQQPLRNLAALRVKTASQSGMGSRLSCD